VRLAVPAWLERYQFVVFAAAVALLCGGLYVHDISNSPPPALVLSDAEQPMGSPVVVHVAGAVVAPGVYELPAGARVQDAVLAARGATTGAELASLNLARRLHDGESVTIPSASSRTRTKTTPSDSSPPITPLDINHATAAELDTLPGIGEAYSRRIVDSRAIEGPFTSVDELVSRRVLPESTLAEVRDYLTVSR
jgi:competence protein ComEA